MTSPNQAQHENWNGEGGERWVADADRRDAVLAPVADALFAAAALRPGDAVLDIGCGCGVTTLAAADAVSPGATVGIDISGPMLELARQRAGTRAVRFLQADAQVDDLGNGAFAVAIGRFGTMFFDDPVAAFTNIGRAMRPGGRLCIATWQPLAANDWLVVPGTALLRYGSLPDTGGTGPGMFAQSDPSVVTEVLVAAGWHDVDVEPHTVALRLGATPDDATDYLADTGVARAVLATVPEEHRAPALDDVRTALAGHARPDGVFLDAGVFVTTATSP